MTDIQSLQGPPPATSEGGDTALVAAIAAGRATQDAIYVRYRRPLMQVFLQRRIDKDAAQDLLQRFPDAGTRGFHVINDPVG